MHLKKTQRPRWVRQLSDGGLKVDIKYMQNKGEQYGKFRFSYGIRFSKF